MIPNSFSSRLIGLLAIDITLAIVYVYTPLTTPGARGVVALTQLVFLALTFGITLVRVVRDF